MNVASVFHRITAALDQAGIPYMLTGSFASAYYGTMPVVRPVSPNEGVSAQLRGDPKK